MDNLKKSLLRILLAIVVFFYTSIPVLVILRTIGMNISSTNYKSLVVYDFISSFIVMILISFIYFDLLKSDLKKIKEKCDNKFVNYLKNIMVGFLGLLAIKYISAVVVTVVSTILGVEVSASDNQAIIEKMVNSLPLLITLSASFFAPVSEEVLFRGGIRKLMNNKGVFITVSGLIFGLMHVTDNIVFILEILFIGMIVNYILNNKSNDRLVKLSVMAINICKCFILPNPVSISFSISLKQIISKSVNSSSTCSKWCYLLLGIWKFDYKNYKLKYK